MAAPGWDVWSNNPQPVPFVRPPPEEHSGYRVASRTPLCTMRVSDPANVAAPCADAAEANVRHTHGRGPDAVFAVLDSLILDWPEHTDKAE